MQGVWRLPLLLLLLLAGCAQQRLVPVVRPLPPSPAPARVTPLTAVSTPPASRPVPAPSGTLLSPLPAPAAANAGRLPAVQGLLAAADTALQQGDTDAAAVAAERAQRLAPRSAAIYQRLAEVRLRQRRGREAEQLARRGLAFAGSAQQQAVLWRQIAAAREQQGQMQAAQEARLRAAALEGTPAAVTR